MSLTPKRKKLLDFIRDFINTHGYAPTLDEMAEEFGVSRITIHEHVCALARTGYLRRTKYRARAIELTDLLPPGGVSLPLLGAIAAGQPITAVEDRQTLDLTEVMRSATQQFVLRVQGDSMIGDHICEGDYVIVERRDHALNGETVVALVNGDEATLKRFYREADGRIRLQAANPSVPPMYPEDIEIQGVVIAVLRRY